ncbi:uncharacterized protein CMU_006100 [Cryptosporidium muris RN66]|uniref:Uncharacterized protein n=1 Tax=Cryptosporidium muris (strain RN66) TaxID=441375 RepID=B6AHJ2_CRYMR|nr:uncharacterized protein CMU_006100 [Cryptosporidium muris RN66]EEA07687.1 hypothetical protein, conserved [Cryptosporidium muris RN66]|eukprot:XP_002142036.1 hypothetical protein [Cryptosporidium muris RN66]
MIILGRILNCAIYCISPRSWQLSWKRFEGKTLSDITDFILLKLDKEIYKLKPSSCVEWWNSPFNSLFTLYFVYKMFQLSVLSTRQRRAAEIVADAYGQGGQWLNPIPK